ncbi:hypothetical protein BHJ80_18320 [Escherichia coli]|nr:hypothetical protein BHJ80_18320 [Escherichia coli]
MAALRCGHKAIFCHKTGMRLLGAQPCKNHVTNPFNRTEQDFPGSNAPTCEMPSASRSLFANISGEWRHGSDRKPYGEQPAVY